MMQFKYIIFDSYLGDELPPDRLSHDAAALLWLYTTERVKELALSAITTVGCATAIVSYLLLPRG